MAIVTVPSRSAAYKPNMHRALLVPEILLIIFKYVTNETGEPLLPTLAALARTCRLFQRQAEDIIWYQLPNVSALYNILPLRVRSRECRSWSLNRRTFSGREWRQFMDRAGRVRVLVENTIFDNGQYERSSAIFIAMASLRDRPLLTPNLRRLVWQTSHPSLCAAINLFVGPSLLSLETDAKLFVNRAIHVPLKDACPQLEHLKITGNARSSAGIISGVLRGLHCLQKVVCSTLDNDASVHLAQLKDLSYMSVDMRWSVLCLDTLRDRLCPDSFRSLRTLRWKDYDLDSLADVFLLPSIPLTDLHLEIESFCTSRSLRAFLRSFVVKFPHIRAFSLVHDVEAGRRFGLQVGVPGREHQLDASDLEPLFALRTLRALTLVDLGHLRLDDGLVKAIGSALPELERLHLETNDGYAPSRVTFDGFLALLRHCPRLESLGLCVDADDMLSSWDTSVRHDHVTHLRLEGSILGSRRAEVDEMLRRVMPRLRTVDESLDGVTRRVRDVNASEKDGRGGRLTGRRTRNSLEGARGP